MEDIIEIVQAKKPADMTLGEIRKYCQEIDDWCEKGFEVGCEACPLEAIGLCQRAFKEKPMYWNFTPPRRYTDQDIADAIVVRRVHSETEFIERIGDKLGATNSTDGWLCDLNPKLFESLKVNGVVRIQDIIKEGE